MNTTGTPVPADKIGDTALAQIISWWRTPRAASPIAAMADKVLGVFVPVVCLIALVAVWRFLGTGAISSLP